jgi:hypothetical protein
MTPLALWRHEVRRTGWAALLTPPVCTALIGLLGVLQALGSGNSVTTARTLQGMLTQGVPLAVGVVAASLVGRDPAVELQLSVVRDYRTTVLRRLAVSFAWAAVIAVVVTVALVGAGWWYRLPFTPGPLTGQLTWLAPSAALGGLGFLLAALSRDAAVAGGLVAGVWIVQLVVSSSMAGVPGLRLLDLSATGDDGAWLANRLVLLGVGVALLVVAWRVLARVERLVRGDEG